MIGIGEMKENYENISSRVQDINRQVTDIEREGVVIDGRVQLFEFYLGGDYKRFKPHDSWFQRRQCELCLCILSCA